MNRSLLPLLALGAAFFSVAASPPEGGVGRPGGEYAFLPAADSAGCAAACAKDQMCLAWTYRVHEFVGCELKAVVPRGVSDSDAVSGIADRAAAFIALTTPSKAPAAQSVPAKPAPTRVAFEAIGPASAPMSFAAAPAKAVRASALEEELLGGP